MAIEQSTNSAPKHVSLTLERIINVVVVVAGLPESDAEIKWLKESAGKDLFANVNPILAKAIFSDNRITFQAGCAVTDPKDISPAEFIKVATSMLDSEGDIGIIAQHGEVIVMMPSRRQIKIYAVIAISFQSVEKPIVLMTLSSPLSPGQMIRVG